MDWAPACMDSDEMELWSEMNDRLGRISKMGASLPCSDCTRGFAAEMRREGRCNGRPGMAALGEPDVLHTDPDQGC